MLTKDKVKELVDHMSDTLSIDDLVERVIMLNKNELGQLKIDNGEGIGWEVIKKEMDTWLELYSQKLSGSI
jgi:hypothetical protein